MAYCGMLRDRGRDAGGEIKGREEWIGLSLY